MARVTQVVNRDGEVVPFRRNRVVRAILASVRAAGSKDEWIADKLADMVVYFLDARHGGRKEPPTADDVDDTIERALLSSPDLHAIAQAFIAGRQRRDQISELEQALGEPSHGPDVSQSGHELGGWDRARIAAALMRENGLAAEQAGEVARAVEERVQGLKLPRVTTGMLRELADAELLSRGLANEPSIVSVPRYDLEQWVFPTEDNDMPPAASQADLSGRAAQRVLADYTLHTVLDPQARAAHEDARLLFESLHSPMAVTDTRLDVPSLLRGGAGFGLQRMYAEAASGLGAALARIAAIVREAGTFTAGPVTLRALDVALAAQVGDDTELIDRGEIQPAVRLLAALAPGGLVIECGPPSTAARDLVTRTLIDLLADAEGGLRRQVSLELAVSAGAFADGARRSLLERAASLAAYCGVPAFRVREQAGPGGGGLFDEGPAGMAHEVVLARVALNLGRAALECPGEGAGALLERLDDALEAAATGLAARVRHLERVALRDLPEPAPAAARMLRTLVGTSRDVALVPVGLGFAARVAAGVGQESDPAAQRTAQQILSYLAFKFRDAAAREGLQGHLASVTAPDAPERMARRDAVLLARRDPESPLRLVLASAGAYRAGAEGDPAQAAKERLQPESALHALLDRNAELRTSPDESLTEAEVLELLRLCTSERGPKPARLRVAVESRTCRDCGARYPARRTECPVCGSTSWAVPPGQRSLFG
jgi:hypothetical protein